MTETQRAAMQQALDAIDWLRHHLTEHHACLHMSPQNSGIPALVDKTEAALRAALAEPQPEPVAWGLFAKIDNGEFHLQHPVRFSEADAENDLSMYERDTVIEIRRLYDHTPTRRSEPEPPDAADGLVDDLCLLQLGWGISDAKGDLYCAAMGRVIARAAEVRKARVQAAIDAARDGK